MQRFVYDNYNFTGIDGHKFHVTIKPYSDQPEDEGMMQVQITDLIDNKVYHDYTRDCFTDHSISETIRIFELFPSERAKFPANWFEDMKMYWLDQGHPEVTININGEDVKVDEKIADAIIKLNQEGAITEMCCQGGKIMAPFISIEKGFFPAELIDVWRNVGYIVSDYEVNVSYPIEFWVEASIHFINILDDWLAGNLDESGDRYRCSYQPPPSPQLSLW